MRVFLILLSLVGFLNADKIFLDYSYDMNKKEISGINKIENTVEFPKPLEVYIDEYNQKFIFLNNKLKVINITIDDFNLKENIENILKSGFRLKSIEASDKFGKVNIKNVGELIKFTDEIENKDPYFSVYAKAILTFKNDKKAKVVLKYDQGSEYRDKSCSSCQFVEGKDLFYFKVLNTYFTEFN